MQSVPVWSGCFRSDQSETIISLRNEPLGNVSLWISSDMLSSSMYCHIDCIPLCFIWVAEEGLHQDSKLIRQLSYEDELPSELTRHQHPDTSKMTPGNNSINNNFTNSSFIASFVPNGIQMYYVSWGRQRHLSFVNIAIFGHMCIIEYSLAQKAGQEAKTCADMTWNLSSVNILVSLRTGHHKLESAQQDLAPTEYQIFHLRSTR